MSCSELWDESRGEMEKLLWVRTECASERAEEVCRLYDEMPDLARAAIESGFDGFMTSEHHWRSDGYAPDALGLMMALGAVVRPPSMPAGPTSSSRKRASTPSGSTRSCDRRPPA